MRIGICLAFFTLGICGGYFGQGQIGDAGKYWRGQCQAVVDRIQQPSEVKVLRVRIRQLEEKLKSKERKEFITIVDATEGTMRHLTNIREALVGSIVHPE